MSYLLLNNCRKIQKISNDERLYYIFPDNNSNFIYSNTSNNSNYLFNNNVRY